jgi:hypothetical protein
MSPEKTVRFKEYIYKPLNIQWFQGYEDNYHPSYPQYIFPFNAPSAQVPIDEFPLATGKMTISKGPSDQPIGWAHYQNIPILQQGLPWSDKLKSLHNKPVLIPSFLCYEIRPAGEKTPDKLYGKLLVFKSWNGEEDTWYVQLIFSTKKVGEGLLDWAVNEMSETEQMMRTLSNSQIYGYKFLSTDELAHIFPSEKGAETDLEYKGTLVLQTKHPLLSPYDKRVEHCKKNQAR